MSKRRWLAAAVIGAAAAAIAALALAGWRAPEPRIAEDLCNGMIFLGLGLIAVGGLIANVIVPTRPAPATERG